jgi:hypothetical protein
MKLRSVLRESAVLTFRDLNSMQVGVLKKIAKSGDDFLDMATPNEMATLDSLKDLNLVDDSYELTPTGQRAAELGTKYGSSDRRQAGKQDSMLGREGGQAQRYTDQGETGEDAAGDTGEPGSFRDRWEDVKHVD